MTDQLKPADGSRGRKRRLGRGPGSGSGKTSGKGHKGQRARSGHKQRAWFEGGQMPLQRRVPKRGFKNPFKTVYQVVKLGDLEGLKAEKVDKLALKEAGLIRRISDPVKVLAGGELKRRCEVTVEAFSGAARQAIEAAGGSCTATGKPATKKRRFTPKQTG